MADRHRPGYYEDYAIKTGRKDRHRKGYYKDYNKKHPERINRIRRKNNIYLDSLGRPRSKDFFNPTMTDLLSGHFEVWHDDDWCEDVD